MSRRSWSCRFALWAAIGALLLKSAVPLLAASAAGLRGVAVAEVCSLYGVALPAADHDASVHAHHHHADGPAHGDHGSHHSTAAHADHCALTALAALALQDPTAWTIAPSHATASRMAVPRCIHCRDASAAWRARLKQGPPALS